MILWSRCMLVATHPIWTPTTISFSFSVSLIIAQFTIFSSFSGPKLLELFWGPKRRFLGNLLLVIFCQKIVISVVVLGEIFPTGYHSHQTEIIWPIRDPGKLMYQLTQKRGPQFGVSSSRVRVWNVKGFPLFLNNKYAFEPHCNTVQRHVAATSLLRDKLPSP